MDEFLDISSVDPVARGLLDEQRRALIEHDQEAIEYISEALRRYSLVKVAVEKEYVEQPLSPREELERALQRQKTAFSLPEELRSQQLEKANEDVRRAMQLFNESDDQ